MEREITGTKVGRNEKCPCGTGLKYKKCCSVKGIKIRRMPDSAFKAEEKEMKIRQKLEMTITGSEAGYYLPHIQDVYKGQRVRALYSRILFRPQKETFHEFIMHVLRMTLGQEWAESQRNNPENQKHFIFEAYEKYSEWSKNNANEEELSRTGRYSGVPDGYTQWLLCLAFDLYCLQHTKQLPKELLNRLKQDGHPFQGARYEIAVASIFARAGFVINFFDETNPDVIKMKHCEFIATDPDTGIEIAVEAKSKHRPGVLHDEREIEEDRRYLKGDISKLLKDAMAKEVGERPYMIFVDLNARHTPDLDVENKPWLKDIFRTVGNNTQSGKSGKVNLFCITNFSYHYQGSRLAEKSETLYSIALKPDFPIPDEIRNKLMNVLNKYSSVPDLDYIISEIKYF